MENTSIDNLVESMKVIGEQLVDYNFPKADPKLEDDLNILKTKEIVVDGYSLIVHYSKADYKTHYLETFQVLSKHTTFLPFTVVTKLAQHFLGKSNLSLIEIMKDNRKIYCWTITTNRRGIPINLIADQSLEKVYFEGLEYSYLDAANVNFI